MAPAQASIPPKVGSPKIHSAPSALVGGQAGYGFSLMNVKKAYSPKGKFERITFVVGNLQGKPHFGPPAYYHAQLMKNPSRLLLDFSQMPLSLLSEIQLIQRLKNSKYVLQSHMTRDPQDNSLSLAFDLKPNTRIRIMQIGNSKKSSQVVVDLL